ncbi:MAG: FAD:protein FMN transferase [Chitinophagales bacterium]
MKKAVLILVLLVCVLACKQEQKKYQTNLEIETMGTWGSIKLIDTVAIDSASVLNEINQLLIEVNNNFSTYIDTSLISKFNSSDTGTVKVNAEFIKLLNSSMEYMNKSNDAFNPKVMPLVLYYGFAKDNGHIQIDSSYIDSLVHEINGDLSEEVVVDEENEEIKKLKNIQLDFSAFAKGYGVDAVAEYLLSKGYSNFMVEIGGEVRTHGKKADGQAWRLGIEKPDEESRSIFTVIELNNNAMATSGNYRNIRILEDGSKIVHTINPKTGYSKMSNLLSATIIADNCMTADAYATACMVMGVDSCYNFVLNHKELECYLIYADNDGNLEFKATDRVVEMIVE